MKTPLLFLFFFTLCLCGTADAKLCNIDTQSPQGCRPPLFVNVNFDGSYNLNIWHDLMNFAEKNNAKFTFYVSGVTFLHRNLESSNHPFSKKHYQVPGHKERFGSDRRGRSRILWARNGSESSTTTATLEKYRSMGIGQDDVIAQIQARYVTMYDALTRGHEIGSHGNGHFYGGGPNRELPSFDKASVEKKRYSEFAYDWSREEWNFEFSQFQNFVVDRAYQAQLPESLFGARLTELVDFLQNQMSGFRAPYLSRNKYLYPALKDSGYVYDASSTSSSHLLWPKKDPETQIWKYPIPLLKVPGYKNKVLGMDFNFQVSNVSEAQAYEAWKSAFIASYNGNRAPLTLGMHVYRMGPANGSAPKGIYLKAMKRLLSEVCELPEVICGTYNQLTQFLTHHSSSIHDFEKGQFANAATIASSNFQKTNHGGLSSFQFQKQAPGIRGFDLPAELSADVDLGGVHDCSKFHEDDLDFTDGISL